LTHNLVKFNSVANEAPNERKASQKGKTKRTQNEAKQIATQRRNINLLPFLAMLS